MLTVTENAETGTDITLAKTNVCFQCHCSNNDHYQTLCSYLFSHHRIIECNRNYISMFFVIREICCSKVHNRGKH